MVTDDLQKDLNSVKEGAAEDLRKIRSNRASPELVEDIKVEVYDTMNPIKNIANISVTDAKSLVIQPWDKTIVESLDKSLRQKDLNASVQIEGDSVRVIFPDLTQERRKELVKFMNEKIEEARVRVRKVRQEYMQAIDDAEEEGMSEDEAFRLRDQVEKAVKDMNQKLEDMRENKEKELMEV